MPPQGPPSSPTISGFASGSVFFFKFSPERRLVCTNDTVILRCVGDVLSRNSRMKRRDELVINCSMIVLTPSVQLQTDTSCFAGDTFVHDSRVLSGNRANDSENGARVSCSRILFRSSAMTQVQFGTSCCLLYNRYSCSVLQLLFQYNIRRFIGKTLA